MTRNFKGYDNLGLILIWKRKKKSLEVGKWNDFVLFDKDIMKIEENEVLKWNLQYLFKRHESQVNQLV
jgi:predicted amidohydrolase YtcJ